MCTHTHLICTKHVDAGVKALNKNDAQLVVMAADAEPLQILLHVPPLCEAMVSLTSIMSLTLQTFTLIFSAPRARTHTHTDTRFHTFTHTHTHVRAHTDVCALIAECYVCVCPNESRFGSSWWSG